MKTKKKIAKPQHIIFNEKEIEAIGVGENTLCFAMANDDGDRMMLEIRLTENYVKHILKKFKSIKFTK